MVFLAAAFQKVTMWVVFNRSYGMGWPTHFSYSELGEAIQSYPNLMLRDGKGAVTMKSSG